MNYDEWEDDNKGVHRCIGIKLHITMIIVAYHVEASNIGRELLMIILIGIIEE